MTAEQKYFLQILSDYIRNRPSGVPDVDMDYESLVKIAQQQMMDGILYVQCKDFLKRAPKAFMEAEKGFTSSIFCSVCNTAAFQELKAEFAAANISLLLFKGLSLANYHRVSELRTMGDIDVLIRPDDRSQAHACMLALGYKCTEAGGAVWSYVRDVIMVEVHEHMIYERLSNDVDYAAYFDAVWDFAEDSQINPSMEFVYLIAHTAKHIINSGSGFRPFLDIIFMAESGENLDWEFITKELRTIKLLNFTEVCFALCKHWFGIEPPIGCHTLDECFCENATEKVFLDGLFGFDNEENSIGHTTKNLMRYQHEHWKNVVAELWKQLFPTENRMPNLKCYSFLFRHKSLHLIAWIYRLFYVLYKRRVRILTPFTERKSINVRKKLLLDWGL